MLLRGGLAFVFLYAAIASFRSPAKWAGFLPAFLTKVIVGTTLIKLFAVYELVLAGWLLSGKFVKYAAVLSALTLLGIVATNPSQLVITFRDIGLLFMAAALYFVEE